MTTPPTSGDDELPVSRWRDRSHADDQGKAVELLTGMLIDDRETMRQAVRTVHRSAAEAAGLVIGLARIAVTLLRLEGQRRGTEPIAVLRDMAPALQQDALDLDDRIGPPLPGSVTLHAQPPPNFVFMIGETMKALAAIHDGVGRLLSPDEGDDETMLPTEGEDWPVAARRLMWEVMQLVSEAADYFRGTVDWDFDTD